MELNRIWHRLYNYRMEFANIVFNYIILISIYCFIDIIHMFSLYKFSDWTLLMICLRLNLSVFSISPIVIEIFDLINIFLMHVI
jgi:hypothetical protein